MKTSLPLFWASSLLGTLLCCEVQGVEAEQIRLGAPRTGPNALVPVTVQIETPWAGCLVYVAFRGGRSTVGFCDTGKTTGAQDSRYYDATNLTKLGGVVPETPLLSPNSKEVLLRWGEGYSFSDYGFAVFSPDTNSARVLPMRARYYSASWSPDGRCIAYMEGGDLYGLDTVEIPTMPPTLLSVPLSLHVFDLQTGRDQKVVASDSLTAPFNWKDARTPVYAQLREPSPAAKSHKAQRPSIFAFSLDGNKTQLLQVDAYRPLPSPDGSRLAFFGSRDVKAPAPLRPEWKAVSTGAWLCAARISGQKRQALNFFPDYPELLWRRDNRRLLTIENHRSGFEYQGPLKEWDTETGGSRVVATLQAHDVGNASYSLLDPKFRFLSISQDGSYAFVVICETQQETPRAPVFKVSTLQAVQLDSGQVSVIARVKGPYGTRIDWREHKSAG